MNTHTNNLQQLSTKLGITITKISEIYRSTNSIYYQAITVYGNMCLVIENYNDTISNQNTLEFLRNRNTIIGKYADCFPLIYQQQLFVNSSQQIICISLLEDCQFLHLNFQQIKSNIRISTIEKFIKSLFHLHNQSLTLSGSFAPNQLLHSTNTHLIYPNLTNITPLSSSPTHNQHHHKLTNLLSWLLFQRYNTTPILKQLILIQDKIYRFDLQSMISTNNLIEIMTVLNICPDLPVDVQLHSNNKIMNKSNKWKKIPIKQLNGQQKFKYEGNTYESLKFISGKCINALIEINYDQLKQKFLKSNSHYRLRKHQNFFTELKQPNQLQHIQLEEDIITVHPPLNKIQLINFLIVYIKCLQPTIKSITYIQTENSLRIEFINKQKQHKSFKIVFYEKYIVKDQQISMIIERAKIKDCKLDLQHMKINDTLLLFLGNSQKTNKITQLCLSDRYGLSDHGMNVLLISPFCQNLQILTLIFDNPLLTTSIQLLNLKTNIKKLYLKSHHIHNDHYPSSDNQQQQPIFDLSKIKLTQLHTDSLTINIPTLNPTTLKILKLTQYIHLDQLKHLKHFQLIELKLKIIDPQKKNLIQSTSSLITGAMLWKHNGIRIFTEGPSSKTLKILDISSSNIKFKTIRPLLIMPELQNIHLNNCINFGHQFQSISPKISKLSLTNLELDIHHLNTLLENIPVLLYLNLINTKSITKKQLFKFLSQKKKYIQQLTISQYHYCNHLIQNNQNNSQNHIQYYQLVGSIRLYIDSLLNIDQQHILLSILTNIISTQKNITFLTISSIQPSSHKQQQLQQKKQKILIDKINKFIRISNIKIQSLNNLSINQYPFSQLYSRYKNIHHTDQNQYLDLSYSLSQCLTKNPIEQLPLHIQHPQIFKVLTTETIDQVLHRFIRLLQKSSPLIRIIFDMSNNRLIQKPIIKAILTHAQNNIIIINFMNCLFQFQQIIDQLFQFPFLQQVNNGTYDLTLKNTHLIPRTQKYLKFFMKIKNVHTLTIDCLKIQQPQLLYTVLYHILDKHSQYLSTLIIKLSTLILNQQSSLFLDKICTLPTLHHLDLHITTYHHPNQQYSNKIWQQSLSNLTHLKSLTLKLPLPNYPNLNYHYLQILHLNFSDEDINQHQAHKILKSVSMAPIRELQLNFDFCNRISNLNKVFGAAPRGTLLAQMQRMEKFVLQLEFCNLKEHSLNQTLCTLSKCQNIQHIEINASFAVSNLKQLENSVHFLTSTFNRTLKIIIIAINNNSHNYTPNQDFNSQKGIEFII